jgi:hypothetical protein
MNSTVITGKLLHFPCDDTQEIVALHETIRALVEKFGAEWICELVREYESARARGAEASTVEAAS